MNAENSPVYFAVGVVVIVAFLIWAIMGNKKAIGEGRGEETDTHDWHGQPWTHRENYGAGIFALVAVLIALVISLINC